MNRQPIIRAYHPTKSSVIAAIALIPVLMLATWPAAVLFGDARTLLMEFVALPLFCVVGFGLTLCGYSCEFRADERVVLIQLRVFLFRAGVPFRVPFQSITGLGWRVLVGYGSDLSMTVAGEKHYYVTTSQSKAKQIAQMVIEVQPNLKPNLHRDLI